MEGPITVNVNAKAMTAIYRGTIFTPNVAEWILKINHAFSDVLNFPCNFSLSPNTKEVLSKERSQNKRQNYLLKDI